MEKEKSEGLQPPPPPPEHITDPDRIAAGEERWQACPLNDCKRKPELLYEDFYLRGIRTDRLMCSQCAIRMEVGYIAREVAKAQDDKFFTGTRLDYVIVFLTTLLLSFGANAMLMYLSYWFVALFVGFAGGWLVSKIATRFTKGRVGRYSPQVAIGGALLGLLVSPPVIFVGTSFVVLFREVPVADLPVTAFLILIVGAFLPNLICTAVMVYLVRNIFRR